MENVPSGTPHKQMLMLNNENTKIMWVWKKSNIKIKWILFALSLFIYANLEKISSFKQRAKEENECSFLHSRLCETWKDRKTSMREVWKSFISNSSFRLFKTSFSYLALPPLSFATSQRGVI